MNSVPYHEEVVEFTQTLCEQTAGDYEVPLLLLQML